MLDKILHHNLLCNFKWVSVSALKAALSEIKLSPLDGGVDRHSAPEIEETNYIEPEPEPVRDREPLARAQTPNPSPNDNFERNQVVSTEQMCKDSPVVCLFC